jgi:hypothetical protein
MAAPEGFPMNAANCCTRFLIAIALFALGAAVCMPTVAAQDDVWQVTRADYGHKSQRTDVTQLVQDLISRGGVKGRVAVNNQTMGGDPAVGKDKSLRIFATNSKNQERVFAYNEGSFFEVSMFSVPRNDWGDRGDNYGQYGRRSRVRDGVLAVNVNNNSLGGDPAVGADKVLIVIYRYQGQEQAAAAREGNTLALP